MPMSGPASSVAQVPLSAVLPSGYAAIEGELRRLAHRMESHAAAVGSIRWNWYPEHNTRPAAQTEGTCLAVFDVAVTLFDEGSDTLELTLNVGWCPDLAVNAALEVACCCSYQDHDIHRVVGSRCSAVNGPGLVEGFAAGTAMFIRVLETGPFDPRSWRTKAGWPNATPEAP